jgi:hypothetical protein
MLTKVRTTRTIFFEIIPTLQSFSEFIWLGDVKQGVDQLRKWQSDEKKIIYICKKYVPIVGNSVYLRE